MYPTPWGIRMLRVDNDLYAASLKDSKTHHRANVLLYSQRQLWPVERSLNTVLDSKVTTEDVVYRALCKNSLVGSSSLPSRQEKSGSNSGGTSHLSFSLSTSQSQNTNIFETRELPYPEKQFTRLKGLIWDFPKCGKLDSIAGGSGKKCVHTHLQVRKWTK